MEDPMTDDVVCELRTLAGEAEEEAEKQRGNRELHNNLRIGLGVLAALLAGLAGVLALSDVADWKTAAVAFASAAVTTLEKNFSPSDARARHARVQADCKYLAWESRFTAKRPDLATPEKRKRLESLRERQHMLERERYD
jgi:hypothetical protein